MRTPIAVALASFVAAAFVACGGSTTNVPVADAGAPDAQDAAPPDATSTDTGAGTDAGADAIADAGEDAAGAAIHYGEWLSQLAAGRVDRTFKFIVRFKELPSLNALDVTLTPLAISATTIDPASTVGATTLPPSTPLAASGRFVANIGTLLIPGQANPISGRDVRVDDVVLTGHYVRGGRSCALMSGTVNQPITLQLDPAQNVVLFDPATPGDPKPIRALGDFVCTPPPP